MDKIKVLGIARLLGLALIFVLILVLQYCRVNFLAPPPESIWDNVYLWDWARNFSNGDFSSFVVDSHHQLRWGNWGFAAILIKLFSDEIVFYYLATLIPSTLAILIFCYLAWKNIGFVGALLFVVLWFFDALLFRATFQLLPSGSALLPVSLLLLLCCQLIQLRKITLAWQFAIAITLFWLYGVKETYLAFMPAVIYLVYSFGGLRVVLNIFALLLVGYVTETIAFSLIAPDFSNMGRIHAIVDGGQHVKLMTEQAKYVASQTRYFDSGITMRWVLTSGVTSIAIFMGFGFALLSKTIDFGSGVTRGLNNRLNFMHVLSAFIISFVIFTTFFVISINPIRLGHPLVPRYVTVLMPLVYLMIVGFLTLQARHASVLIKFGLIAMIPFYIASSIDRYSNYRQLSIFLISDNHNIFAQKLDNSDCVRAKGQSILLNQLDLIPEGYRTAKVSKFIADKNPIMQKQWFVIKLDPDRACKNMYSIYHHATMRY